LTVDLGTGPRLEPWRNEHYRRLYPALRRISSGITDIEFPDTTRYGLSAAVSGNFVVTTKVRFFPKHQYDQAGLMIRVDGIHWIKMSVEYELEEPPKLGVVVTNRGYSDWSLAALRLHAQ